MCDTAKRAHAAGYDNHCIWRVGTAGERSIHALEIVHRRARWKLEAAGEFFGNDGLGIIAEHDMDLMLSGSEAIQEALGIKRAAGSSDGDE